MTGPETNDGTDDRQLAEQSQLWQELLSEDKQYEAWLDMIEKETERE